MAFDETAWSASLANPNVTEEACRCALLEIFLASDNYWIDLSERVEEASEAGILKEEDNDKINTLIDERDWVAEDREKGRDTDAGEGERVMERATFDELFERVRALRTMIKALGKGK